MVLISVPERINANLRSVCARRVTRGALFVRMRSFGLICARNDVNGAWFRSGADKCQVPFRLCTKSGRRARDVPKRISQRATFRSERNKTRSQQRQHIQGRSNMILKGNNVYYRLVMSNMWYAAYVMTSCICHSEHRINSNF